LLVAAQRKTDASTNPPTAAAAEPPLTSQLSVLDDIPTGGGAPAGAETTKGASNSC
jgi:hypothetical protein